MDSRPGKPPGVPQALWELGDVFLPRPVRDKLDRTILTEPLNGWTLVHFASGVATAMFLTKGPGQAQAIHAGWEVFQVGIGMSDLGKRGEVTDVLLDTLAFTLGFLLIVNK